MPKSYTCQRCHGSFVSNDDWTEEDVRKEHETLFPGLPKERQAIVCEDCFKIIMGGVQ